MDYNYGSNDGRRRSANQNPYLRPQDNNVSRTSAAQTRNNHVHNPARYGNVLDEMSLPMAVPATPQTPALSGYSALQFQTPFPSMRAPPHISTPRTPYSVPSSMDYTNTRMMPTGSPAMPHQHYEQFPGSEHCSEGSMPTRYDKRMPIYEQFVDFNEALQMPTVDGQEYNLPVLHSVPHDAVNKPYAQPSYAAYKPFMQQYPSSVPQQHFAEPIEEIDYGNQNAIMPAEPCSVNSEVKFSEMSITYDEQLFKPIANIYKQALPESAMTMSVRTEPVKETPKVKIASAEPLRIFSGPIGKMLTWDTLLQGSGQNMLYEVIAPFVAMRHGAREHEKMILLREIGMPAVQCFFQEQDRELPVFKEEQLIRCVGKMMSKNKMRVFSVRAATAKEKACLHRLQFICNRVANDVAAGFAATENKP